METQKLTFCGSETTYYANFVINSGFTMRAPISGDSYEQILAQIRKDARANTPEGECAVYEVWHKDSSGKRQLDAAGLLNYLPF